MKKKVLCTALAVAMLLSTTVSATAKPWWLSKYRVDSDGDIKNGRNDGIGQINRINKK